MKLEQAERRAKWQALVNQQKQSGLTQKEFCKEQQLTLSTFAYYSSIFGNKNKKQEEIPNNNFIPIAIKHSEKPKNVKLKIIFPNGMKCLLPQDLEINTIKKFIEVLNSC
jgi:hypothetical protein